MHGYLWNIWNSRGKIWWMNVYKNENENVSTSQNFGKFGQCYFFLFFKELVTILGPISVKDSEFVSNSFGTCYLNAIRNETWRKVRFKRLFIYDFFKCISRLSDIIFIFVEIQCGRSVSKLSWCIDSSNHCIIDFSIPDVIQFHSLCLYLLHFTYFSGKYLSYISVMIFFNCS